MRDLLKPARILAGLACLAQVACGGGELFDPPAGSDPRGWPDELRGDWGQVSLGDCFHLEEWWRLRPPETLVRVLVDRNACEPGGVSYEGGLLSAVTGRRVDLSWGDQHEGAFRRFVALVLERSAPPATGAWPADYTLGVRALNTMAYAPDAQRQTFSRTDWRSLIDAPDDVYSDQRFSAQLSLEPPLDPGGPDRAYRMRIRLFALIDLGTDAPPATGMLEVGFDGRLQTDPLTGWQRLVPEGFDDQAPRARWSEVLGSLGAADELPARIVDLFGWWFVPVFAVDPGGSGLLFNDLPEAWHQELLGPPPDRIE